MSAWEAHYMIHYANFVGEEFLATGDQKLLELLSDIIQELFAFAPEA